MNTTRLLPCIAMIPAMAAASCWNEAATTHNVDPTLLKAIAWQESRGNPRAIGPSLSDGNRALGVMQINTIHLPELSQWGITRNDLFEACTNQKVGAWILKRCIDEFGALWRAVGCYYAGPRSRAYAAMESYVSGVRKNYEGYMRDELSRMTRQGDLSK